MITQIEITNHNSSPVVFRGTGFHIYIPANVVDLVAQIPTEDAQENIQNLQLEHPSLTVTEVGVSEGIPTNDLLFVSPDYLDDANYQGVWDASSGADPHATPEAGWYWRVTVAGSHPMDGIMTWDAGDHAKWNGTRWMKIVTWVAIHEHLSGLLGGAAEEHYHLNLSDYAMVVAQNQILSPESNPTFAGLFVENFTIDGGVLEGE